MRSALIFILDRFTGSLKWTNSAKFVVEIDVTFFLSGKVLLLPLLLLIMLRVFVLWLEPNFVSSIVARWCDWAFCSYAKTSYIVKCIFMWAIHFHSRRFFLLHHLYFMLLSHFLSSLSYLNRFFFQFSVAILLFTYIVGLNSFGVWKNFHLFPIFQSVRS